MILKINLCKNFILENYLILIILKYIQSEDLRKGEFTPFLKTNSISLFSNQRHGRASQ